MFTSYEDKVAYYIQNIQDFNNISYNKDEELIEKLEKFIAERTEGLKAQK